VGVRGGKIVVRSCVAEVRALRNGGWIGRVRGPRGVIHAHGSWWLKIVDENSQQGRNAREESDGGEELPNREWLHWCVVARCAKVAQHWALRAIEKKCEKRREKKNYSSWILLLLPNTGKECTLLLHTAVYYNTAAVYDIFIIEYTRFIESGSRRAEQLLVCTLSYYILLFCIIYILLYYRREDIESLFPFRVWSSGRAGRSYRFTKPPAGSACASVRPSVLFTNYYSLLRPRASSPSYLYGLRQTPPADAITRYNHNIIIVVLIIILLLLLHPVARARDAFHPVRIRARAFASGAHRRRRSRLVPSEETCTPDVARRFSCYFFF